MPIETTLLREGCVLLLRYTDPFDGREALANTERYIREVYLPATQPIYSISDFTGVTQVRLNMLNDGLKILRRMPPTAAHLALVTNTPVANGIANTLGQMLAKQNVAIYRSVDAAWAAIDALLAMENNATASKGGGAS